MTDLSGIQQALGAAARDLAALFSPQADRLLRLHTPLGPDAMQAERVEIAESIGPGVAWPDGASGSALRPATGYAIDLLALSNRADIDATELLGQPVLLELLTANSRTRLRPFHGHVTSMQLMGADGGYARYRLRIEPWTALLAQRVDAWTFQDMDVLDITEAIFADYAGQGALQPRWRVDVADRSAFARRSLCTQFNETDLNFLRRLWAEEGLFTWFEHAGDATDAASLGRHTLVIADHNGVLTPNARPLIRFTQPGAVMKEDSITSWHGVRRIGPSRVALSSFDYRSVTQIEASAQIDAGHAQALDLPHVDQPGAYAFETPQQAQRRTLIQLQGLEAARKRFEGRATVRTLAPGSTFTLLDHAEHVGDHFAVLGVVHRVRNNLNADATAGLQQLLGDMPWAGGATVHLAAHGAEPRNTRRANASEEPVYEARLWAQRATVPVRVLSSAEPGRLTVAKPVVHGTQTAVVVGLDGPVHTDRDARIKVQFHWQRGAQGAHRLDHPAGDNAPATDASGTWVRVGQPWSGANWGVVFIPRLGQEVVVAFVEGDIDRPVVIGATYNGQGQDNAQGNTVAAGSATATGNAPAWFPGSAAQGERQGHAHTATLSGFKSQSLDASQGGSGGHNQLVLDDTPAQGRLLAHTTQHQSWLQMGHLLQQADNQRLQPRGHGLELHTQAQGAVRAAAGLHLSSHARQGGTTNTQGRPMDTREVQQQLAAHAELLKALAGNAQTHLAKLPNEAAPAQQPAHTGLRSSVKSLRGVQGGEREGPATSNADVVAIDGGHGQIPVSTRPDLVVSAAADIASLTPAHSVLAVGGSTSLTAGQDTNLLAQRHAAWAVKGGISLFTRGESKDGQRAVQDAGMKLHAASGNVNVQAQSGAFTLTALKGVDLQSTAADIVITAPEKIVLNGGGGYVKIEGGNIEIGTSGAASFKGSMKELGGGGSGSAQAPLFPRPSDWQLPRGDQFFTLTGHDGQPVANRRYRARTGNVTLEGFTDAQGKTGLLEGHIDQQARFEMVDEIFDEHFVLLDVRGEPLANFPYVIRTADGVEMKGVSDDHGRTALFISDKIESVTLTRGPEVPHEAAEGAG
jgi:type VI secretion system secreted protein VgrG